MEILLVVMLVVVVGWRADRYVDRLICLRERMAVRDALAPVPLASPPADAVRPPTTVTVPDDIVARALSESEEWAQDDLIALAKEKYAKIHDWQLVRRAIGIAEMP